MKIPIEYPAWALWKSKEIFLPPEIHSVQSFKTTLGMKCLIVDAPLLLLGLLYREVCQAMEVESGDETAPAHLIDSPLGIKELDQIEKS